MSITDSEIFSFNAQQLIDRQNIEEIYEEEPEERDRLITAVFLRADEIEKAQHIKGYKTRIMQTFSAFNRAVKELEADYTRQQAIENAEIPLRINAAGKPETTIDNFYLILQNDEHFSGIRFNLLSGTLEKEINEKCELWTDADDAEARRYIEKKYRIHSKEKYIDALNIIAKENSYHPIRQIIESIEWDGESRIYKFLNKWAKCEDTPYTREVSRLIFAGGIHRIYNPGCKFDVVPVLIGTKQGEGKSTLISWLALDDKFFSEVKNFDNEKGAEAIEGSWICEIPELAAMNKTTAETVKAFISCKDDKRRMKYARHTESKPRQCIFIGSTNSSQFLKDKTGNRRFFPITVRQNGFDLYEHEEECKEYIKQCWAEAKVLYDNRQLEPFENRNIISEIRAEQAEATEEDYRIGLIEDYLSTQTLVCILEIHEKALEHEQDHTKPTARETAEISQILINLGWERGRNTTHKEKYGGKYGRQRWYSKAEEPPKRQEKDYIEVF